MFKRNLAPNPQKKVKKKNSKPLRSTRVLNIFSIHESGRTMLEVLMALLILGMISAGGYAGVRYALGLSQAWRAQAQVNQLGKDVISLYAWQDSYATLSMQGRRGICNTIVSPGNQDCKILSPWNEEVRVSKGKSNASFKIVLTKTPRSICEHLKEMRYENVFMVQKECTSGLQDIEFVMDKNDRACEGGCPTGYECINGECRSQEREEACENVSCGGECLTGECRGGVCLRKMNGTSCSIGVCQDGMCVEETTVTHPEVTTPEETTMEEETTTPDNPCGANEIYVEGICYSCNQYDPISALYITDLQGCSNRTVACATTGTMDCKSFLKQCPEGYVETGSSSCQAGEIPINDGSITYDYINTGCCRDASKCPALEPLMSTDNQCYPCDYDNQVNVGTNGKCVEVCPGERTKDGSLCYSCDMASSFSSSTCLTDCAGKRFSANNSSSCYSCNLENPQNVGSDTSCEEQCSNRVKVGNYCALKCNEGVNTGKPIQASSGKCYACDYDDRIGVGSGGECASLCEDGERFQTTSGACYPCDYADPVSMGTSDTSCSTQCPNRKNVKIGNYNYCILPCGEGVNASKKLTGIANSQFTPEIKSGACYACTDTRALKTVEDCEATCPGVREAYSQNAIIGTYCILKTCPSGTFKGRVDLTDPGDCYSCAAEKEAINVTGVESNCNVCGDLRKIYKYGSGSYCGLTKECDSGDFRMATGSCRSCSMPQDSMYEAMSENDCLDSCPNNMTTVSNGKTMCASCTYAYAISTTKEVCDRCSSRRHYYNGLCCENNPASQKGCEDCGGTWVNYKCTNMPNL